MYSNEVIQSPNFNRVSSFLVSINKLMKEAETWFLLAELFFIKRKIYVKLICTEKSLNS